MNRRGGFVVVAVLCSAAVQVDAVRPMNEAGAHGPERHAGIVTRIDREARTVTINGVDYRVASAAAMPLYSGERVEFELRRDAQGQAFIVETRQRLSGTGPAWADRERQ